MPQENKSTKILEGVEILDPEAGGRPVRWGDPVSWLQVGCAKGNKEQATACRQVRPKMEAAMHRQTAAVPEEKTGTSSATRQAPYFVKTDCTDSRLSEDGTEPVNVWAQGLPLGLPTESYVDTVGCLGGLKSSKAKVSLCIEKGASIGIRRGDRWVVLENHTFVVIRKGISTGGDKFVIKVKEKSSL